MVDGVLTGKTHVGLLTSFSGELLETTGSDLIDEYTSYVLGLYFNAESRWFTMKHTDFDETSDVNQKLAAQSNVLYQLISKTNYYSQSPRSERDNVLHGHTVMVIVPDLDKFAKCRTLAPRTVYLLQDVYNDVYFSCWEETLKAFELKDRFPNIMHMSEIKAQIEEDITADYELLTFYTEAKEPFISKEELEAAGQSKAKYIIRYIAIPSNSIKENKNNLAQIKYLDIDEVALYNL